MGSIIRRNLSRIETRPRILVIDDEKKWLKKIKSGFSQFNLTCVHTMREAGQQLRRYGEEFDLILLDLEISYNHSLEKDGLAYLRNIKQKLPDTPVVIISKYRETADIVQAIKNEADDYLYKGAIDLENWRKIFIELIQQKKEDEKKIKTYSTNVALLGSSPQIQELKVKLDRHAHNEKHIFLLGATGTGKDSCVHYLHEAGVRSHKPLITINLGTLNNAEILSNILSGKTDGKLEDNFFRKANRGILYLKEVEKLDPDTLEKLLAFLDEGAINGQKSKYDIQMIVSSLVPANVLKRKKDFLGFLYYRLNRIRIPSLGERRDDIEEIIAFFFQSKGYQSINSALTKEAKAILLEYKYPGNILELESALKQAIVNREHKRCNKVDVSCLPREVVFGDQEELPLKDFKFAIAREELKYLERALELASGHKSRAAEFLKVKNADALRYIVQKYRIQFPELIFRFPKIVECYKLKIPQTA